MISEKKMQIVINNYFKSECDVNTSIRQAFEKGFRIGVEKGRSVKPDAPDRNVGDMISGQAAIDLITGQPPEPHYPSWYAEQIKDLPFAEPERKKGKWIATYSDCGGDAFVWVSWKCSNCDYVRKKGWKNTDDGKKPDALFCEMCNADMRGEQDE